MTPFVDGLWTLEFRSAQGYSGSGVAVLERNAILGGDDQYYYVGRYVIADDNIRAILNITAYVENPIDAFGRSIPSFSLSMVGRLQDGAIVLKSTEPDLPLAAKLTKRAELP